MSIYDELGVPTVINAAGTFTSLGGSLMEAEVQEAWASAAGAYVDLTEWLDCIGSRIAELLQVEAALVTAGAASGIALGTAAAVCRRDPEFIRRQPMVGPADAWQALRWVGHRDAYDRQVEMCGVRIVDVKSEQQLRQLAGDRTIMLLACNLYEPESDMSHARWLELAQQLGVPALLDAAADTPPVKNLSRLAQMGYDMVVFSGGKAIGGPQDTGLLLGRRELIDWARQNAAPREETIGRGMKVTKEDAAALWKAVERFVQRGETIAADCDARLDEVQAELVGVPSLICQRITPPVANHFPHLRLSWDENQLPTTPAELKRQLWSGTPRIATERVSGTGTAGFLISAINLRNDEPKIVGRRIREILTLRRRKS